MVSDVASKGFVALVTPHCCSSAFSPSGAVGSAVGSFNPAFNTSGFRAVATFVAKTRASSLGPTRPLATANRATCVRRGVAGFSERGTREAPAFPSRFYAGRSAAFSNNASRNGESSKEGVCSRRAARASTLASTPGLAQVAKGGVTGARCRARKAVSTQGSTVT